MREKFDRSHVVIKLMRLFVKSTILGVLSHLRASPSVFVVEG